MLRVGLDMASVAVTFGDSRISVGRSASGLVGASWYFLDRSTSLTNDNRGVSGHNDSRSDVSSHERLPNCRAETEPNKSSWNGSCIPLPCGHSLCNWIAVTHKDEKF